MAHVCIVTTAHAIDDMRVRYKIAQSLVDAGLKVSWVGPAHQAYGNQRLPSAGIEFKLTPPIISGLDRLAAPIRTAMMASQLGGVDVYIAPDPDAAYVALWLAGRTGGRVVFDIHEIYHGALLQRWLRGWSSARVSELVRRWIARICARADLVMGVSHSVLAPYTSTGSNQLVIRSCAPKWFSEHGAVTHLMSGPQREFRMMHGRCHALRGTGVLLEALRLLPREDRGAQVVITVQGDPVEGSDARAVLSAADACGVRGELDVCASRSMKAWRDLLLTCDVGLVLYGRDLGIDSLPNRLFEYMAVGLPVIAPIYSGEIARIVQKEHCGLLVDCEDPKQIAAAMLELKRDSTLRHQMGLRARESFLARHCWDVEVQPLLDALHSWGSEATKRPPRLPSPR